MYKKLILSVLVIFITIELTLHFIEDKLSIDINHYNKMDNIINSLSNDKKENILFLGNSLTRRGIDKKQLEISLPQSSFAYIYPDDTSIIEWYWVLKTKIQFNKNINTIVVSFVGNQLQDKSLQKQQLMRISSVISQNDFQDVLEFETLDFDQSTTILLSYYSKIFSLQERINNRVLDLLPNYRILSQTINKSLKVNSSISQIRHTHLEGFLKTCKRSNIKAVFIAMPLPSKYPIDKKLYALQKQYGFTLIDAQNVHEITPDDYLDGYHLNPLGAKKLTSFLIKQKEINKSLN